MRHGGKRKNAGRKKGSGYLTEARRKLLEHTDEIIDALIERAKEGDTNALKLCVERIIPIAKETHVFANLSSPDGEKVEHFEQIKKQVLKGELSISDAKEQISFLNKINYEIESEKNPSKFNFDFSS